MLPRLLRTALTTLFAVALLLFAWPQLLGLERVPVIAQAVALRGAFTGIALLLVILLLLIAVIAPRMRSAAATIALLLCGFALINAAVLGVRGFGTPQLPEKAASDLVVFSWNTYGDAPGADAIAGLALANQADLVVLPETSSEAAGLVADRMARDGHPMQLLSLSFDDTSTYTTVLLVGSRLGAYHLDERFGSTEVLPSLVAVPDDGSGPTIVAAHPISPVPGEFGHWLQGQDWLSQLCQQSNIIVAGDFNSTLDHYREKVSEDAALGRCYDAAKQTGSAALGTWPSNVPAVFGAAIDHVMASDEWEVTGFQVIQTADGAGSDHRPVVAQLRPAAPK